MLDYLSALKEQFNSRIEIKERRPNIFQVIAPFYHEDGDMMNIFITPSNDDKMVRICDFGKTLMRLSYVFEIDTDNKRNTLLTIITENMAQFDDGNIYIDVEPKYLYNGIMQFSQVISKVSNLNILSRESVSNLFYDYLSEYVENSLKEFNPKRNFAPLSDYPDLVTDYYIPTKSKPLFVFGIRDDTRASKVIITCLQYQRNDIDFRSVIIFDTIDKISKFYKIQVMDVCDKQFSTLDSFKSLAVSYLNKELK